MLVLTLKVGKRLVINGDTIIELREVGRGKAKIGATAPREVSVLREELVTVEAETESE